MPNESLIRQTAKSFAAKVRDLRRAQRDYVTAPNGSETKQRMLNLCRTLEREVDAKILIFDKTIDNL